MKSSPSAVSEAGAPDDAQRSVVSRWEFWPAWAVYAPLVPWILSYAIRHGGLTVAAAANPSIPMGGLIGESKWDILCRIDPKYVVPSELIGVKEHSERLADVHRFVHNHGNHWPIVLKPDVGERGTAVRLVETSAAAAEYLRQVPGPVMAQVFHPGPFEAGVFFIRWPEQQLGQIFSITDKQFPEVVGDGHSTIAALIDAHPRLRRQARVFLDRLGSKAHEVPGKGNVVRLAFAGNHCRGTMFLDGASLITEDLASALSAALGQDQGLYFGRFDIRYGSAEEFQRGQNFQIVEFNGVLSESTNIYDPACSFWQGQRVLREQWRMAYRIGHANVKRGAPKPSVWSIIQAWHAHSRRPGRHLNSD